MGHIRIIQFARASSKNAGMKNGFWEQTGDGLLRIPISESCAQDLRLLEMTQFSIPSAFELSAH